MPRKRNPENQGLPNRWRMRGDSYFYQVPPGAGFLWGGKREFKLGNSLSEASETFNRMYFNPTITGDTVQLKSLDTLKQCMQPCNQPCVYFLFEKTELVYIGQSKKPLQRILQHGFDFDHMALLAYPEEALSMMERLYVAKYQPRRNVVLKRSLRSQPKGCES